MHKGELFFFFPYYWGKICFFVQFGLIIKKKEETNKI